MAVRNVWVTDPDDFPPAPETVAAAAAAGCPEIASGVPPSWGIDAATRGAVEIEEPDPTPAPDPEADRAAAVAALASAAELLSGTDLAAPLAALAAALEV